nr:MAG TPA: hypothetical protein [Caudoviricetes sp.]
MVTIFQYPGCHVYTMTPECYKRKLYKKSAK